MSLTDSSQPQPPAQDPGIADVLSKLTVQMSQLAVQSQLLHRDVAVLKAAPQAAPPSMDLVPSPHHGVPPTVGPGNPTNPTSPSGHSFHSANDGSGGNEEEDAKKKRRRRAGRAP